MKLSKLAVISAGQGAPQGESAYGSEGIPFIKAGDLASLLAGKKESEIQHVNESVAKKHKLKLYPAGSILFAKSGMSCMKGYVYKTENLCYVVSHLAIISPTGCNADFLKYYFQFHKPNSLVKDAAYPSISLADIGEMEINVPSLSKQQEIVAELENITELIVMRKEQLTKLDQLVKARFVELFGDTVQNPMGWKIEKLKKATSKIGSGATPKGGKESYQTEGITLIRSMNVHDGRFEYKDLAHITDEQAKQLDNVTVEEHDVFINITGASVARSCIVPGYILPARVNQHVAIIRCITSILNPVFTNQIFLNTSFKSQLLDIGESGGATRQAITKQQLEALTVILPPIELQKQFATFVEQTDKSKLAIQQSLDKLETLKKSLMQEYFG